MTANFSVVDRKDIINELEGTNWDLLVIGGGITGAGILLDARKRGMRAALVEMQDFASGTSSRSTKLVHGGLRYLKQLEIGVVAEVGKERAIVYENAPHVTTPEWMVLPIYKGGTFGWFSTSMGLRLYDWLAGVKRGERRRMLGKGETLKRLPLLKQEGLKGSGYYVEYRTDDARLTLEVMKKAVEEGAKAVNYVKVERFRYEKGQLVGVEVSDQLTGRQAVIHAAQIVNAAGPWVDKLREKDGSRKGKTLHLTKGVHLVFDQSRLPLHQAVYFDTPDKRMVFAIPREGKTYVGTTDTTYTGNYEHPRMTKDDRDYLLKAVNALFPSLRVTAEDVESSWAGLRPLIHQEGKDPSEISRKDEIFRSPSGLLSIAGGKLTGYRKMAEAVVNRAAEELTRQQGKAFSPSQTMHTALSGGDVGGSRGFDEFVAAHTSRGIKLGLSPEAAEKLARFYGSNVGKVHQLIVDRKQEHIESGLPLELFAALEYAMSDEMAVTPMDFWIRRSGSLFFHISQVRLWKEAVQNWMGKRLNWTDIEAKAYGAELDRLLAGAVEPASADADRS
ncbi:glycerol-3-phosphate dehydrogenase/oxidase [Paenibacillus nasutitermitis]|uniref:Aerobic glycerol-3-phosphate dehydrogenase n=1 Tax=Paenibacillus nasutitermitis TaxID=1652958 RepID=A0A916YY73_9BACL|nr:FAD-dependent oxidoreductase [Paenibacillus nasutitermitis]GGD67236.1 aerobic glycerol-3-phosphate dehydrogenase [Paenibacillus nasutitermitis]